MFLKDPDAIRIAQLISPYLGMTVEDIDRVIALRAQKRAWVRNVVRNHKNKFDAMHDEASSAAHLREYALEREGYRLTRLLRNAASGNVAMLMQRDKVWSHRASRLVTKLAVVYPDGSMSATEEKTISVKKDY